MDVTNDPAYSSMPVLIPLGLLLTAFLLLFSVRRRQTLPPGPRQLPFIGNIHQLPAIDQHKTFAQWGEKYGERVIFHRQDFVNIGPALRQATYSMLSSSSSRL